MAPIALYYPWMHFQDSDWLKLALLSWDGIVRLRPRNVEDRDSPLVREIRDTSDWLHEITPSARDLETVAAVFTELINEDGPAWRYGAIEALRAANPSLEVGGREPFGPPVVPPSNFVEDPIPWAPISQAVGPAQPPQWPAPASGSPPPHARELLWIYCGIQGGKMSLILREELVRARLAQQISEDDPWIGLHPTLGSVYLAALADAVARSNALSPVTDDPRIHHAVGALDHLADLLGRPVSPALADTRAAYVDLTLRAVVQPRALTAVPVSDLLAFRSRHRDELTAYRAHIDGLAEELAEVAAVENAEVAQVHMQALFERTTKPQLDDLRKAARAFGIDTTVGVLRMKVDLGAVSGTALGTAALVAGRPAVESAAIAVAVVPYVAGRLKAHRQQRTTSPVAYLLAAERTFNRSTRGTPE